MKQSELRPQRSWIAAVTVAGALVAATVLANGNSADRVLGQFDFTHSAANLVDAKGFSTPHAVAIDASTSPNRVYVADAENNRVLGWNNAASFANGAPADLVVGQPDFISYDCNSTSASSLCTPTAAAVDGSGNLYVADSSDSRVLEYTNPFAACGDTFPCVGGPAHLVFGQESFSSRECDGDTGGTNSTAVDLCDPTGVALDGSGNLFVADAGNDRVLRYNTPLETDLAADIVFGQGGDFTSNNCNFDTGGGNPTAHDLCDPSAVAVDGSGNLYVADTVNERVLEYNAPFGSAATANEVFGQGGSFTSNDCDGDTLDVGSSADDLCDPTGVAVDGSGNLYIADATNNRVLEYNTPLGNTIADAVFGQGEDFTSNVCNFDIILSGNNLEGSTANDLCLPVGVAADSNDNLFVADGGNSRVLKYDTPLTTDTTADGVLGQLDFTHQMVNLTDAQGLLNPEAAAIDASATPNRLYVVDFNNNRVLGWKDSGAFASGAPADLVIGQPDFLSYFCDGSSGDDVNAGSLCLPEGIAVDSSGNLYVADTDNNRVLEYANPFVACNNAFPCVGATASVVVGQGNFTSSSSNDGGLGPSSLDSPTGVAVDGSGNLYIADSSNNRVLEYNAPLTTGTTAARVFGQGGSFTSKACNFDNGGSFSSLPSAIDLCDPFGVALDSLGNLYVADYNNHRVLEYNTPLNASSGEPGAGDATADTVFGQNGSFTTKNCNSGGISASNLCVPTGLAVDGSNDLYIADGINNRVLEYDTPLTTDTIADRVFGTCGSFKSSACTGVGPASLNDPTGIAVDNAGRLFVDDNHDNRVLAYDQPLVTLTATPTATATPSATSTPTATATPTAIPAMMTISPASLAFGTKVKVGSTSKPKGVTIKNTGSKSDPPLSIQMESASPSVFVVKAQCKKALAPGKSCKASVIFKPTDATPRIGTLMVFDSAAGSPQSVPLSGTGMPAKKK